MKDCIFQLFDQIRETSVALHEYLRHAHLAEVYAIDLAHRLRMLRLKVDQQFPLKVLDEDGLV